MIMKIVLIIELKIIPVNIQNRYAYKVTLIELLNSYLGAVLELTKAAKGLVCLILRKSL